MCRLARIALVLLAAVPPAWAEWIWIANAGEGTISVVDTDAGNRVTGVIQLAPGARPTEVALSPTASELYVTDSGRASLWFIDTANRVPIVEVPLSIATPFGLAVGANGTHIFVGNADGGVTSGRMVVVNRHAQKETGQIDISAHGLLPIDLALSPDGARLYIACATTDTVAVYDRATSALVQGAGYPIVLPGGTSYPYAIGVLSDSSAVYVADDDPSGAASQVVAIDAATLAQTVHPLRVGERAMDIYSHPTAAKVLVPTGPGGTVRVVDTLGQGFSYDMFRLPAGVVPTKVALNEAGTEGAVTDQGNHGGVLFISLSYDVALGYTVLTGLDPFGVAIAPVLLAPGQNRSRKPRFTGGSDG